MKKTIEEIRNMTLEEIRNCIEKAIIRIHELKDILGEDVYYNEEFCNLDTLICYLDDEEEKRCGYHDHLFDDFC